MSSKFKSMLGENIMISFCFLNSLKSFPVKTNYSFEKSFHTASGVEIKINVPGITLKFFLVRYKIIVQAVLLEVCM